MKTKENTVFKGFIALCFIISLIIFYILLIRPLKVVVSAQYTQNGELEFIYSKTEANPSVEKILEHSDSGKHIIVVMLTPTHKLLANYQYEYLLDNLKKCQNTLPCPLIYMDKEKFHSKAKKRKDIGRKKNYSSFGHKKTAS